MTESVGELVTRLEAAVDAVAAVDVVGLPAEAVEQLRAVLGAVEQRVAAKRLELLPVAAEQGLWADEGSRSFAQHLARGEGRRLGSVRGELRLAKTLRQWFPLTRAAVLAGRLGLDYARVIAQVADTEARREMLADPECGEGLLLAQARGLSVEQFAKVCAAWAYRADPAAEDEKYRAGRDSEHLHVSETMGGWAIKGWLAPDSGQLLRTALDAVRGRRAADDARSLSERDSAALVDMARIILDGGEVGAGAVVRPHLSVHVDYATLVRLAEAGSMVGVEPARLDDGTPIPAWLLATIACDSQLTRIVFGPEGQVLDVGRTQRTFTTAQRRGIVARDRCCVWDGCDAPPSRCQAHHLQEWNDDGPTDIANGALLCWHHHEYLHRMRLRLHHRDTGWVLTHADGRPCRQWPARVAA